MNKEIEGQDYIICQICGKQLKRLTISHLKTHNITFDEYIITFPNSKLTCDNTKILVGISNIGKRSLNVIDNSLVENGIEGYDYIICPICKTPLKTISYTHLKTHNMTIEQFKVNYPNVDMICEGHRKTLSNASVSRVYDDNMTIDEWLKYHTNRHFCECGCGGIIKIDTSHHQPNVGIPEYIPGHSSMLENGHVTKERSNQIREVSLKMWEDESRKVELSIRMINDNPMYNPIVVQK